jgi:glycosyltransferase involved in cell wall biosynthesis
VKFLYIANARLPTEKAHGLQIIKMCEALAQGGAEVELVVPFRMQTAQMRQVKDVWNYYGVEPCFRLRRLPSLDLLWTIRWMPIQYALFYIQALTFFLCAVMYCLWRRSDIVYTRDWLFVLLWSPVRRLRGCTLVLEEHRFPHRGGWGARLHLAGSHRVDRLVVITHRLRELYVAGGIPAERVLVAPDGVDVAQFEPPMDRAEARKQLGLPVEAKIVCYTGHLFEWKGVYVLADAALHLPDVLFLIVGGMAQDRERLRVYIAQRSIKNVRLIDHVPPTKVPSFLFAADVLVLPNISREPISSEYTSPLKIFEYMASGTPIVATDLPAVREVLKDGENAVLVAPDEPQALAAGIECVLGNLQSAARIGWRAREDVEQYTWEKRARRIGSFCFGGRG